MAEMEQWTAAQCAEHAGIKPATWRAMVSRKQAPARIRPDVALWDAATVRAWHARRPGQGARTDLMRRCDACNRRLPSGSKAWEVRWGPQSGAIVCGHCHTEAPDQPYEYLGEVP